MIKETKVLVEVETTKQVKVCDKCLGEIGDADWFCEVRLPYKLDHHHFCSFSCLVHWAQWAEKQSSVEPNAVRY